MLLRSLVLVLVLLTLAGCGPPAEVETPTSPPDLLLITVDTLRADRLGAYGGSASTPALDALALEGMVFDRAVCPMPVTRPAQFSIFTGRLPREHGVLDNLYRLPDEAVTLAEVLRDAGYQTAASVGVVLLDERSGAMQGFETFEAPRGVRERSGDEVIEWAVRWLAGRRPERPFFLWVHLFDPHIPYAPPADLVPPEIDTDRVSWLTMADRASANGGALDRADWERGLALYDGEVASVDRSVGRLLEALRKAGTLDDTVVAFTADHGECFENGYFFRHAGCLYEGAVRVPLILRYPPAVPRGRSALLAEHVDLGPTVLRLVGQDVPSTFAGIDLLAPPPQERWALVQHPYSPERAVAGRGSLWAAIDTVMGEPMRPVLRGVERLAVRGERWKYIVTGGEEEELYDLTADPAERHDLAAKDPERVTIMRERLKELKRIHPLSTLNPVFLHRELREHLEALGYL